MVLDSDPVTVSMSRPDDFASMLLDIASGIQFKLLALMFIAFMVINSDVFINRILARFTGAVEFKSATTWGTFIQAFMLVFACLLFDVLIKQNIV